MRIAGGNLGGRTLAAPPGRLFRPSAARLRQAVFDLLLHARSLAVPALCGAWVLDAFAGTGAFGIEALSRGAAEAVFIDRDLRWVRRNIAALGLEARARTISADATRPPPAPRPADIAFLDPPYGGGLAAPALVALAGAGWLAPSSLAVVETGARERPAWPDGFALIESRRYGAAQVALLAVSAAAEQAFDVG